jgi:2'-hydroxyisoflavone reductase
MSTLPPRSPLDASPRRDAPSAPTTDGARIPTRRTLLGWGAALGAAACFGGLAPSASARGSLLRAFPPASAPKKLLVLGGTRFLGPAIVDAALARGHEVVLFNRGRSDPERYKRLEQLEGDRDGNLKALEGRKFDSVIDTSGYVPRVVRASAELLAPNVGQYVFISSISVYAGNSKAGADESDPVGQLSDPNIEEMGAQFQNYGPLKAACEAAAEAAMPGRVANVRPGLIVGPEDSSDRYTYWPMRLARGGDVLCPGAATDPVQYIDVRDLGEWLVLIAEQNTVGVFNATGPQGGEPMGTLIEACREASGVESSLTWVPADFLMSQGVRAWQDMPVWVPPGPDSGAYGNRSVKRALEAGLKRRSALETARATLEWARTLPQERLDRMQGERAPGLRAEREANVLAAWKAASAERAEKQG